jgi:hypothetical protein
MCRGELTSFMFYESKQRRRARYARPCLKLLEGAETCDYSIAGIQRLDLNHYYFFVTTGFFATILVMEGLHREHIQTPRSAK